MTDAGAGADADANRDVRGHARGAGVLDTVPPLRSLLTRFNPICNLSPQLVSNHPNLSLLNMHCTAATYLTWQIRHLKISLSPLNLARSPAILLCTTSPTGPLWQPASPCRRQLRRQRRPLVQPHPHHHRRHPSWLRTFRRRRSRRPRPQLGSPQRCVAPASRLHPTASPAPCRPAAEAKPSEAAQRLAWQRRVGLQRAISVSTRRRRRRRRKNKSRRSQQQGCQCSVPLASSGLAFGGMGQPPRGSRLHPLQRQRVCGAGVLRRRWLRQKCPFARASTVGCQPLRTGQPRLRCSEPLRYRLVCWQKKWMTRLRAQQSAQIELD